MKTWLMILIMKVFNLLSQKKYYCKIEQKNNICIYVFCYKNSLVYPVYVSNKKVENCMDLLMVANVKRKKNLIMCILRILTELCAIKQ